MTKRLYFSGLSALSLLIVSFVSLPLIYLIIRAWGGGEAGLEYLMRPRTRTIFINSVQLTVIVVLLSGIVGTLFAWLTARTDLRFRRVILVLGLIPMVIPSYIGSLTLVTAFGPVGYLQKLLEPLGVERLPNIYGLFGASLAITLFTYPYFVLPVRAALMHTDRGLEEAAQSLGSSRWAIFWRVTFPALRPAMAAGALLTALYTLSDFGAVMVMRYNAFARAIFIAYEGSFNRNRAAILALVLVSVTLVMVWMERRATDKVRAYRVGKGIARRPVQISLGFWQIPALLFIGLLVGIGVFLPVGILLDWAINPNITSPIDMELDKASWNAVSSSTLAAVTVGLAALPLAILARRSNTLFSRTLISLAYIGNALPGLVIGLALVFFGANAVPDLYQTLPLLILGYAVRFLPYSLASTRSALARVSPSLEEAAQSLGLNTWQSLLRVTIPLTWSSIVAGMALVFLNTMKELPTTLMLAPIGFRSLATRIWMASEAGLLPLIGLPGLLLIGVSCVGLGVFLWRDTQPEH